MSVIVVPLSPRELEMLRAAAVGESMRETASRLFFSPETVKVHRKRILWKLGARNITHAVALGIGLGLIDPASPE